MTNKSNNSSAGSEQPTKWNICWQWPTNQIKQLLAVTNNHTKVKDTAGGDEGGHKPLVELVHDLEVHVVGGPHLFIHQVQSLMRHKLVQVPVVLLL